MSVHICKIKWIAIFIISICMIVFFGAVSLAKSNDIIKDIEDKEEDNELYKCFKISNGYARLDETKMVVMKGIELSFENSQIIDCSTSLSLKLLLKDIEENMSDEQKEIIFNDNSYKSDELGSDLFCKVISVLFGNGTNNYFKDTTDKVVQLDDNNQQQLFEKFYNLDTQSYLISSAATIEGCNMLPVEVYTYVNLTKINFIDGRTIRLINTDVPLILEKNLSNKGFNVKSIKPIQMEPIL